ncbi:MAG: DUF5818 domain-containing protein [Candidatus Acidiferrales bacterium]
MRRHAFSLVALVFLFGLAPTHSSLQAGVTGAAQSQRRSAQPPEQDRATKTFTGKIVKSGDKLVLQDDATSAPYELDDQQKAAKFAGKKVKVTGTLDMANNMIRVQSIESVA